MSTLQYSEGHAWVKVKGAFFPDVIEARPGERLRLVFRREETAPSSERVLIASLGKSVMLPPFEDGAGSGDGLLGKTPGRRGGLHGWRNDCGSPTLCRNGGSNR